MSALPIDYDIIFTPSNPPMDLLNSLLDELENEDDSLLCIDIKGLPLDPPHGIDRKLNKNDMQVFYFFAEPSRLGLDAYLCLGKLKDEIGGLYFSITASCDDSNFFFMTITVSQNKNALFDNLGYSKQAWVIQVKTAEAAIAKREADEAAEDAAYEKAFYDKLFTKMPDPPVDSLPFDKLAEASIVGLPNDLAHGIDKFNPGNVAEYCYISKISPSEDLLCLGKLNDGHYFSLIALYKEGDFQDMPITLSKDKAELFENLPIAYQRFICGY